MNEKEKLSEQQRNKLLYRASYWKKSGHRRIKNNTLSTQQDAEVCAYWGQFQDLFEVESIFHSFYYEKTGLFDVNFMPGDIHYCYVDPFYNKWDIAPAIDNKCLYRQLFKQTRQPRTPLCRMNGIWTNENLQLVGENDLFDLIADYDEFVVKQANESEGGKNVIFISGKDKREKFINACATIKKDLVIQESIKQHAVMNSLNPSSINTIRVLSLLSQDGVTIYSAILRMGVNGSRVDNISQGGITCGIDGSGHLKKFAYSFTGNRFEAHPTTGTKFCDVVLPNFDKVCQLVKEAHPSIPNFRLVSWDVCIDQDGEPLLVEANLCYGELNLHQLCNGPLFGSDTQKIMNEVFGIR